MVQNNHSRNTTKQPHSVDANKDTSILKSSFILTLILKPSQQQKTILKISYVPTNISVFSSSFHQKLSAFGHERWEIWILILLVFVLGLGNICSGCLQILCEPY